MQCLTHGVYNLERSWNTNHWSIFHVLQSQDCVLWVHLNFHNKTITVRLNILKYDTLGLWGFFSNLRFAKNVDSVIRQVVTTFYIKYLIYKMTMVSTTGVGEDDVSFW